MKLLIVDDSFAVRTRLEVLLSALENVEIVGQATSRSEGIAAVRNLKPDLVVVDIQLPGGIDFLRDLKADPDPPTVVALTNFPYRQYRFQCSRAGADFVLDKATEFERLTGICSSERREVRGETMNDLATAGSGESAAEQTRTIRIGPDGY
ncbi:MAG: response regulator transcription factor [Deltaproteobacteria bacterium]|nr:response regulator transcription factor [Deltaproteobacteria bacterium]